MLLIVRCWENSKHCYSHITEFHFHYKYDLERMQFLSRDCWHIIYNYSKYMISLFINFLAGNSSITCILFYFLNGIFKGAF